jgi:hypothetical protein
MPETCKLSALQDTGKNQTTVAGASFLGLVPPSTNPVSRCSLVDRAYRNQCNEEPFGAHL